MSPMMQTTLNKTVSYEGIGLHAGLPVHMTLRAAEANTGIHFIRTDLPDSPAIPANLSYVTNTMRATTLEKGEAKVFTVEHLLSALQGLHIDNCIVEMDSVEPPVADGSSADFVTMIKKAGIRELNGKFIVSKNSTSFRKRISLSPSCRMTGSALRLPPLTRILYWACSLLTRRLRNSRILTRFPLPVLLPLRKSLK